MIKCESCGGALHFDIPSQKMKCTSCQQTYDVGHFNEANDAETIDMTVYTCPECGGEIYANEQTAQGFCSFCGASTTLSQKMVSWKKPNKIIPFQITRDEAKNIFAKKMASSPLTPSEYKNPNYIDSYRGIYMPFWVYKTETKGNANISYSYDQGNDTYWYSLQGSYHTDMDGFSHDASTTFADDVGDGVVPFDFSYSQEFNQGYLSGFYADTADVESSAYHNDILEQAKENTYAGLDDVANDKNLKNGHTLKRSGLIETTKGNDMFARVNGAENYMCPVWFLSYRNQGRVAYAAINGQTGRIYCDIPIDSKKFSIAAGIIALIIFIFLQNFVSAFTPGKGCIMIGIISAIVSVCYNLLFNEIDERNLSDKERLERKSKKKKKLKLPAVVGVIINVIVVIIGWLDYVSLVINRNDMIYYGLMCVSFAIGIAMIAKSVMSLNQLSTRKLPQYNYEGGNTNA